MKNILFKLVIIISVCLLSSNVFADETICEMNGMTIDGYGLFIGFLSIVCGLVFCMGINYGGHK
jgi:hypothetical protein